MDILLDDPEGGANQGFREAEEVRWRGAAKLGRETSRAAKRHLTKNLLKKLLAECTPTNKWVTAPFMTALSAAPLLSAALQLVAHGRGGR